LRTPGNYVFIPALYIACEVAEIGHGSAIERGLAFLPYLGLALVPVLLLSAAEHALEREHNVGRVQHFVRIQRRGSDFGRAMPIAEGVAAIAGAVAIAAVFAEWRHAPHAQWVVWSAASVVTGDVAGTRRKLGDRATGALLGVPFGLILALAVPHAHWVLRAAGICGVLTLIIFRLYPIAFGARCALISLAMSVTGELSGAAERIENVLIGGAIGLVLVLIAHECAKMMHRQPRPRQSARLN
jgi:hypothetical protein